MPIPSPSSLRQTAAEDRHQRGAAAGDDDVGAVDPEDRTAVRPFVGRLGDGRAAFRFGLPIAARQESPHISPFSQSLVTASGEHEWMSEVGEREKAAGCRRVGRCCRKPLV